MWVLVSRWCSILYANKLIPDFIHSKIIILHMMCASNLGKMLLMHSCCFFIFKVKVFNVTFIYFAKHPYSKEKRKIEAICLRPPFLCCNSHAVEGQTVRRQIKTNTNLFMRCIV